MIVGFKTLYQLLSKVFKTFVGVVCRRCLCQKWTHFLAFVCPEWATFPMLTSRVTERPSWSNGATPPKGVLSDFMEMYQLPFSLTSLDCQNRNCLKWLMNLGCEWRWYEYYLDLSVFLDQFQVPRLLISAASPHGKNMYLPYHTFPTGCHGCHGSSAPYPKTPNAHPQNQQWKSPQNTRKTTSYVYIYISLYHIQIPIYPEIPFIIYKQK